MEAPGHGTKKEKSHEGHTGEHNKWMEHALRGMAAVGIGLGTIALAPGLLEVAQVLLPQYIGKLGIIAGGTFLYNSYADKGKGTHDPGHH